MTCLVGRLAIVKCSHFVAVGTVCLHEQRVGEHCLVGMCACIGGSERKEPRASGEHYGTR